MKKLLSIMIIILAMGTSFLFAFGIGIQGGTDLKSGGGNTAITFKLDTEPWVFAVNGTFNNNYVAIGGTADTWMTTKRFASDFYYYYGWGFAANVVVGEPFTLNLGGRVLTGINLKLLDNFIELYAQVAWQPTIKLLPDFNFEPWHFPVAGGIRFWIY